MVVRFKQFQAPRTDPRGTLQFCTAIQRVQREAGEPMDDKSLAFLMWRIMVQNRKSGRAGGPTAPAGHSDSE